MYKNPFLVECIGVVDTATHLVFLLEEMTAVLQRKHILDANGNLDEQALKRVVYSMCMSYVLQSYVLQSDIKEDNVLVKADQNDQITDVKVSD